MRIRARLDAARKAFEQGDVRATAQLHDPQNVAKAALQQSKPSPFGTYIGSMVYGALDGIVTTFAVVSGVEGADLSASITLILGIANLLADGFSMGVGDYLSTQSERE